MITQNNAINKVSEFMTRNMGSIFQKGENELSLLEVLSGLRTVIQIEEEKYNRISNAFKDLRAIDTKFKVDFVKCPDCGTPVLLEFHNCNICGASLMEENQVEEEPKKKTKAKEEKTDAPVKTQQTKVAKATEEVVEEVEETDNDDIPSEDDILAMSKPDIGKVIKKFELDVKISKYQKLDELRAAVNNALDEKFAVDEELVDEEAEEVDEPEAVETEDSEEDFELEEAEEVEEEETEEEEIEEETEEEDLDLDDLDFDDIDDAFEGMEEEEEEDD